MAGVLSPPPNRYPDDTMKASLLLPVFLLPLACAGPLRDVEGSAPPVLRAAPANPVELGAVHWYRNLEVADAEARRRDDPLVVLFQEVPG